MTGAEASGKSNLTLTFLIAFGALMFFCTLFFITHGKMTRKARLAPVEKKELIRSSQDQQLQKFSLMGFDDKGKTFWNLEGEKAKIDPTQHVFLDDNVTLRLKDDTVVRTDHVEWSQDGGLLKTAAPVFVDHQNVKIKGMGAVGRPSDSFIQLNRNIEMVINATTKLICEGPMKIFYKQNKIIFYRHVHVKDERGTVSANRMDVFFNPEQKKISQILATGNVVIERGTDTTHSQRAIYTAATGSIRLEGSPEVTPHKQASENLLDAALRN